MEDGRRAAYCNKYAVLVFCRKTEYYTSTITTYFFKWIPPVRFSVLVYFVHLFVFRSTSLEISANKGCVQYKSFWSAAGVAEVLPTNSQVCYNLQPSSSDRMQFWRETSTSMLSKLSLPSFWRGTTLLYLICNVVSSIMQP